MDLGCIDMGCVEKQSSVEKENSPKESISSASKSGKNNRAKDAVRSSINALNKLTSQIGKPPRRKTSPINWFPRKKVEPYLKRKIKMLQEVDGMHSTLDETLGDSNPHYSRVLREKIAIREAADKAIKARKAAMVEASWCRILKAARIGSKEAEAELSKAETAAAEACQAARAIGVIMNDVPESAERSLLYKTETSTKGGEYTAHSVSAIFETAFEVDKQVATVVKAAFIKLASCPSISKDEFKDLLRKISENPDSDETSRDFSPEVDSSSDLDSEIIKSKDSSKLEEAVEDMFMENIVEMMLDRLKCLKEDELASLATIVATCGLSAALTESENTKNPRRSSIIGGRTSRRNSRTSNDELPSLDKFLVKKLTRLEREVLEAKNARNKNEAIDGSELMPELKEENRVPDLGSVLVKKHCSKLEREVLEAKNVRNKNEAAIDGSESKPELKQENRIPDLGSVLVKKHCSRLEKEVLEAKIKNGDSSEVEEDSKKFQRSRAKQEAAEVPSLDKVLVKRLSRLEREVQEARNGKRVSESILLEKENADLNKIKETDYESLDKVLVKHVSKLERAKLEFCVGDEQMGMKIQPKRIIPGSNEGSLDAVLVKHKSRLEREKMAAAASGQQDDGIRHSVSRRQARERELQDAWGGLSLGNSIQPHVSRLQKDKAAWLKAEDEERKWESEGV